MSVSRARTVAAGVLVALIASLVMVAPTGAAVDSAAVVPTPNTAADESNFLEGVSCVSASFCVAVGSHETVTASQTLALAWNGTTWALQMTPNVSTDETNLLYDVSCVSASFCVAVGRSFDGTADRTLAMVWNGTTWALQTTPNIGSGVGDDNELEGVSCVSASFCVAVGNYYTGTSVHTLAMVWNGSTWTLQSSPNTYVGNDNYLNAISCLSTSFCVATGAADNGTNYETLAMVWNGSTWTLQSSPNVGTGQSNRLEGVSCVSESFCVAAGDYRIPGFYRTMAMVWDGATWALQSTPNIGALSNEIDGVSCASASLCVMVGYHDDGAADGTTAIVWDGSAWTVQSTPNAVVDQNNHLNAVACVSDRQCVAVGDYDNGPVWRTLAVTLTGPEPPPAPPTPRFTG
jgi:hypothetical protein